MATGALLASPSGYQRLRRLVRAGAPREAPAIAPAPLADELGHDTREARLSLRARLAEADELLADPAPSGPRERIDSEPLREAIDSARGRMREKARLAATWAADASAPDR